MEAGELHYSPFSGLTISDMTRLGKDKRFIVSTKGNEGNARTKTIEFKFCRNELTDSPVQKPVKPPPTTMTSASAGPTSRGRSGPDGVAAPHSETRQRTLVLSIIVLSIDSTEFTVRIGWLAGAGQLWLA